MSFLDEHLNSVICGDSYELIKQIPDNSIDCIYTDPPYEFHCGIGKSGIFKDRITGKYDDLKGTILTKGVDLNILHEFIRVSKSINIFLWCNKEQIYDYLTFFHNDKISFEILTWHKMNPTPLTKNTFLPDTEYCLYFREKGKVKLNDGYNLKSKYFISSINVDDKKIYKHPTIKPLELVKKHLLHTTQQGAIILDPFSGSGTSCVAAKEIGRNFIGIEINEEFHKISLDRLNGITKTGQTSIFTDFDNL